MPQEIRHVIFNDREMFEMFLDTLASRGHRCSMKAAAIDIGSEERGGTFIRLRYCLSATAEPHVLILAGREALTAAIHYCRSHRVPLPMTAEKTLDVVRGQLTLVLRSPSAVPS